MSGQSTIAVCITGQIRVLVAQGLHVSTRANVLDPLGADAFLHVALDDTRAWGIKKHSSSDELGEAVRVLRPVAKQVASLHPPVASTRCAAQLASASAGSHACRAHDCGTFSCGCYLPECSHCDVSTYLPQHTHNERCLQLIAQHEARRGSEYEWVMKWRPDLQAQRPLPPLRELTAPLLTGPPTICLMSGDTQPAPPDRPVDDKFALMSRRLARLYLNATAAFDGCYARKTTEPYCAVDGSPLSKFARPHVAKGGKLALAGHTRMRRGLAMLTKPGGVGHGGRAGFVKGHAAGGGVGAGVPPPKVRRSGVGGGGGGGGGLGFSPYWATPQCVLTYHLKTQLHDLHTVKCITPPRVRLVRPR